MRTLRPGVRQQVPPDQAHRKRARRPAQQVRGVWQVIRRRSPRETPHLPGAHDTHTLRVPPLRLQGKQKVDAAGAHAKAYRRETVSV